LSFFQLAPFVNLLNCSTRNKKAVQKGGFFISGSPKAAEFESDNARNAEYI
jgi:hypothetical protein